MKTIRLRTHCLVSALLLLMLTSISAQAQDTDDFLSQLHSFRVSNYVSLDAYYRFIGSGTNDTLNEIVAGINTANDSMNLLAKNTRGILSGEQIEGLNSEFDKFKALMRDNINDVRNTGYPDLRLVSDMANQALIMNDTATELYQVAQENSQTETDPRVEAARLSAVKIAQMMAKYSVRTNSSVAQTFQGSSTEKPLDEQAMEFDQLLAKVVGGKSDGELKVLLDDVEAKWQFIRGSYVNYNENNVGFVIDRYSKRILESLTMAIGLLQQNA
ncbi:hypothetical protein [Marinobacter sp. 2_MG-2023]|uniref:hypothetical protein n=1 Tax=Marinobacter sp. 2_MG-2023 TaxID=3062679 RepID=UPI0026E3D830|nr:hypothetical protein [Marinobacter sp. 2_MG-2023]MDO6442153.1 hypothetical protein [Marinobacter sp. 2_MG-2023]